MIDCVVSFLGPDLDMLEYELHDIGKTYLPQGFKATHLDALKTAVMGALCTFLGEGFTYDNRQDWDLAFSVIISKMK